MFTGIIEQLGTVEQLSKRAENLDITVKANFTNELKVDQSVAHNGVCLTVVSVNNQNNTYVVTAVKETLEKTNLGAWQQGSVVNLERCMQMGGRLDGHIVQGHVDQVGKCLLKEENEGSWRFVFSYKQNRENTIVEKGSICINGISLTAFNVTETQFEVAIIPYTYQHTNLGKVEVGDTINLEFDIIGKYISRLIK